VFPTCVGMNRFPLDSDKEKISVPHMRGDEPLCPGLPEYWYKCSPHAWG